MTDFWTGEIPNFGVFAWNLCESYGENYQRVGETYQRVIFILTKKSMFFKQIH